MNKKNIVKECLEKYEEDAELSAKEIRDMTGLSLNDVMEGIGRLEDDGYFGEQLYDGKLDDMVEQAHEDLPEITIKVNPEDFYFGLKNTNEIIFAAKRPYDQQQCKIATSGKWYEAMKEIMPQDITETSPCHYEPDFEIKDKDHLKMLIERIGFKYNKNLEERVF